jgi:hypothetical protein
MNVVDAFEADAASAVLNLARRDDPASSLTALSPKDVERVWAAIAPVTGAALNDLKPAMVARQAQEVDPKAVESVEAALYMLRAVVLLSRATIVDKDREAPEVLLDVAVALHDIVFDLPSCRASDAIFQSAMELQGAVVELCEIWWLDNREGGAELVPQAISYMGVRVLHELASTADVKRLYTFRSALQVLDYADESVRPLKRLLLHVAIKPLVLRVSEGRKLVAHIFSLHAPFVAELHRAIKTQIPTCRKAQRVAYGEVYFRAWRNASDESLELLERDCLQDLMYHAVHASSTSMASSLRQVLGYATEQKRQRGVDGMLLRLWEPILWRALKAANPLVRRNAATLFFEAFPLQDAALPAVDLDKLLASQFTCLGGLLKDACVAVRVVAVHGTCRILTLYSELLPAHTAKELLATLTRDLAHDAAASSVRVAVLDGLKYVLSQSEPSEGALLLKPYLPVLAPLLDDSCERVRASLVELLLALVKTKGVGVQWHAFVSPSAALARLPVERPAMQMRLTRLLLPLYLPSGKPAAQQAKTSRLLRLLSDGALAARSLLTHAPRFVTASAALKLLRVQVCALLSDATDTTLLLGGDEDEPTDPAKLPARSEALTPAQAASRLEAIATFVDAMAPAMALPSAAASAAEGVEEASEGAGAASGAEGAPGLTGLCSVLTEPVMEALEALAQTTLAGQGALRRIAAWLPASAVPQMAAECLQKLAAAPASASPAQLAPLLACACAWGQHGVLMASLAAALQGPAGSGGATAGAKRGRHASVPALSAALSLRALWAALATGSTRAVLISKQSAALRKLLPLLAARAATAPSAVTSADEALLAMSCYVQLAWHLAAVAGAAAAEAAANAATAGGNRRRARGARQTRADKAAEDAEVAAAEARRAQAAGCAAVESLMLWTEGGSLGRRPGSLLIEPSPGEARAKTRSRLHDGSENALANSPAEGARGGKQGVAAAAEAIDADDAEAASSGAGMATRQVVCAWVAEAAALGFLTPTTAEKAAGFVSRTIRMSDAADDADAAGAAVASLLPHAAKLVLALADPAAAEAFATDSIAVGRSAAPSSAPPGQLALSLVLQLLACRQGTAAVLRGAHALLLEVLALAPQAEAAQAWSVGELLYRLLRPILDGISTSDAAASEGGLASLGLAPLLGTALEVISVRSSTAAAALMPALCRHLRSLDPQAPSTEQLVHAAARLLEACPPQLPGAAAVRATLSSISASAEVADAPLYAPLRAAVAAM